MARTSFPLPSGTTSCGSWGRKEKTTGPIVLDVGDRKVRIHTGYGLEGSLPIRSAARCREKFATSSFAGRYAEGINEMTVAVANKVADDAGVKLDGVPEYDTSKRGLICRPCSCCCSSYSFFWDRECRAPPASSSSMGR